MISAYEARRRAEEVNNGITVKKKVKKELKRIEKQIREAVKEGSCSIDLEGHVSCKTADYLYQLGYKVIYSVKRNTTEISWLGYGTEV